MITRWVKFNTVGIAGTGVQLAMLWLCARLLAVHYLVATIIAVEAAVLHNFAWHEVWTWPKLPAAERWGRLARFHAANGAVSIASNALFMWLFQGCLGIPLLPANLGAIVCTAIINFLIADLWVFRPPGARNNSNFMTGSGV